MSFGEYTMPEHEGFCRTWWVKAAWAHPLWHSYAFLLYDLTEPRTDQPEPYLYREGMTHELLVYALDPNEPEDKWPPITLEPANYGYQFPAASHEAAEQRVLDIIDRIEKRTLSPDTDYRSMWDDLFKDGATLHRSGW